MRNRIKSNELRVVGKRKIVGTRNVSYWAFEQIKYPQRIVGIIQCSLPEINTQKAL